jgi:hypothetical protein
MSFLCKHNGESWEDRFYTIQDFINTYFDPQSDDEYFIIDPFILPYAEIGQPIRENKMESNPLAILLSFLIVKNNTFSIITSEVFDGFADDNNYPVAINFNKYGSNAVIEVCRFAAGSSVPGSIHDRWIIQKRKEQLKGLHFGPSFGNIDEKDVTITEFSNDSINEFMNRFSFIWEQAINIRKK